MDRGDEPTAERGLPGEEPVAVQLEADRVAGQPGTDRGRDAAGHLATPHRARCEDRPRRLRPQPVDDSRGDVVLRDGAGIGVRSAQADDLVGTPAAEPARIAFVDRDRDDAPAERCRATEELARRPGPVRLDEHCGRARGRGIRGGDGAEITRVVECGVERAAGREDLDRAPHLLRDGRVGKEVALALGLDHLHPPDPRRARRLAPRPGPEVGGGEAADPVGGHRGPTVGIDLARVDEALGRRDDRGEREPGLHPAVVVLAAQVERAVVEREVADRRREGQVEELGELRPHLAGVGVDGVAAGDHEVEGPDGPERAGERGRGGEGVGARERFIAHEDAAGADAAVEAPGDRLPEGVLGRLGAERDDGDRAAVGRGEVDRLGDGAPAVRVHLELEPVAHEPAVGTQRHGLELRDLLDERSDREAHAGPILSGAAPFPD